MSGGHFNYQQYRFRDIADEIKHLIETNNRKDEWGRSADFSDKTLDRFYETVGILEIAEIMVQRIDWLICGDDGEDTFHERLEQELTELYEKEIK